VPRAGEVLFRLKKRSVQSQPENSAASMLR
jgi:hypothetical protein